jgi:hypothetical protein
MMAVFGWVCLVIMMLVVTASWFIMWLNHRGRYTIGGAENSVMVRMITNFISMGIFFAWYLVFAEVPFTVSMK